MQTLDGNLKWFATRVINDKTYVFRYMEHEGLETAQIRDLSTLLFIHTSYKRINELRYMFYDKVLFYKSADKRYIESVPDQVMKTFLIMAPFHDEPVMYLSVDDPGFFVGPRKRVISGPFKGCEGVMKRLKGERRLIVRLSDRSAIATPYISKDCLENID